MALVHSATLSSSSSARSLCSPSSPSSSLLPSRPHHSSSSSSIPSNCFTSKSNVGGAVVRNKRASSASVVVRSSLDTTVGTVGQVTEVDKDTFWPIVNGAGDKTVVLDMYTQWCGPCKIIAPKYQELSQKYEDVIFLKLDCNQENKPLAKELGIRVVPTFKILKHDKVVKEVTGAKLDDLVAAIETVRTT